MTAASISKANITFLDDRKLSFEKFIITDDGTGN